MMHDDDEAYIFDTLNDLVPLHRFIEYVHIADALSIIIVLDIEHSQILSFASLRSHAFC